MPALFLGVLVAGCVWCCTRERGDRAHPATMLANFKRGVKRVKRQFRPNMEPQDDFSYAHSRAKNQLIDAGMSRRQALRAIDAAYDKLIEEKKDILTINGRDLAALAWSLKDQVLAGKQLPPAPPVRFVLNGRGAHKRRHSDKTAKKDAYAWRVVPRWMAKPVVKSQLKRRPKGSKTAEEQAIRAALKLGIPRKALEDAAREASKYIARTPRRSWPADAHEWFSEITSEDWLDSRYRQEVINGRNIGSEHERAHGGKKRNWRHTNPFPKSGKRQRRNGTEGDDDMVARPGHGPPSRVPGKYAFDDPAKRAHRHGATVTFEHTPFDPYTDTIDMVKYRHERERRKPTAIPEYVDYAKVGYRTDFWLKQAASEPAPAKKGKARKNGRSSGRCRPKPRRCPSDRAGTITWLAEQMCVSKAKAKHLLDTYGGPKRSRPSPNAVEHIAEMYPEFGEAGLKKWKFREPSKMGPRKGGSKRSRRNGRSWNDQNLTGHSWSTARTPDGGSVTVHRDASGRVVERDVLSGKQHATKMKGVRDRMSKRSSGAVAILVRQGVSKTAAKRAVDFVGADSSDTAGELASRARTVLGGGGRLRRPKQSLRRAFVSGAVRHKPMMYRRAAKRRRNRGRR